MDKTNQVLQFGEEGYWEEAHWSRNPDDEEWIHTGWQVRNFDGDVMFRHREEEPVRQWLADNGYTPTGDGWHFSKVKSI